MPGVNLGPVVLGAFVLAALTYVVFRSVQRTQQSRRTGQRTSRSFSVLLGIYVAAWIGYGLVIAGAMAGEIYHPSRESHRYWLVPLPCTRDAS